ncbi:MAG: hypothetical protein ACOY9Y_07975 [Bacillota bacterium]
MSQIKLDPNFIPEPIKSMLEGIDLKAFEAMLNSMSKEELKQMFSSAMTMVKQQMSPEEFLALEDLLNSMLNQKGRLG